MFSASIDRVDNSKGYTKDNCHFLLFGLNRAKSDGSIEDLYMLMEAAVKNRPNK